MKRFDIAEAMRLFVSGIPVAKVGDLAWHRLEDGKIFVEDASGVKRQQMYMVFMPRELMSKDWTEVDEEYRASISRRGA